MRNYPPTGGRFSLRPKPGRLWVPPSATPGDTTAPAITSVTASAGTYYFVGRTITFTVTFSEAVTVTGTPRIALTIGAATRYATYASGSGTTTLTFTYTFVATDTDTDGFAATSPMELNSGTIRDAAGNNATLTFSAPDMSAKRGVWRGVTWATDFELNVPDVPGVLDGTTISASVGVQGSTINSDTNDPTSIPGTGIRYDGNDYCSSIPYAGGLSDYVDTGYGWTITDRFYLPTGGSHAFFSSMSADGSKGSWGIVYAGKIYWYNPGNSGSGSGDGGYRTTFISVGADPAYATLTLVATAAGAGGIKVYLNGTQVGTLTGGIPAGGAQTDATLVRIGWTENGGVFSSSNVKSRATVFCNVAHTDAEVAANHAHLASLPNAA